MIHVAFLNDVIPVSGGAERLLVQTLLALDGDRFQRTLIVTRWDPEVAASDAGAGVLLRLEQAGVRVVGVRRTRRLSRARGSRSSVTCGASASTSCTVTSSERISPRSWSAASPACRWSPMSTGCGDPCRPRAVSPIAG